MPPNSLIILLKRTSVFYIWTKGHSWLVLKALGQKLTVDFNVNFTL